jgi:hypothetical protein
MKIHLVAAALLLALLLVAATARADWPIRFADGTVVEVVGIRDNGGGDKWWKPDGSETADPQFQSRGMVSVGSKPGTKTLQLILKTSGQAMAGKNLIVRAAPDFDHGLLKFADMKGEMYQVFAPAPADQPTCTLRLALASGPANETVLWQRDRAPAATQPAAATIKFLGIEEEDGQTLVRAHIDRPAPASKEAPKGAPAPRPLIGGGGGGGSSGGSFGGRGNMPGARGPAMNDLLFAGGKQDQSLAVIARGKTLQPTGYEGDGQAIILRFRCPLNLVDKVVINTRAYDWIEMQKVSTQPASAATEVKVVPVREGDATSTPGSPIVR